MSKPGSMKDPQTISGPDDEAHKLAVSLKDQIEAKAGTKFDTFQPIEYATQLVNGTNYFIKVKTGDNEAVHVRAWRSFQDPTPSLHSVKTGKKVEDPLEYF
eukprot:TRINITY_DN155_c0_g1_i1.p2 TRINITY_DN155_c0_g1~~TRINITY_DN155_c0_g1_i1.p2  ORF type:complete len:101 (+),score=26.90 TRINITY_DN155_c0_g1_i1:102-404(+)